MHRRNPDRATWDDGPLVRRALANDPDAWHGLVERYSAYVFSLLKSARLTEADQPDAFQYVFIELFKALPRIETPGYLAPWIRQTAIRHAIRVRGKHDRERALEDTEIAIDPAAVAAMESAETGLAVRQAVASLKEQCRQLVSILFFEDPVRPYHEVAAQLGIKVASIGNIRQRCLDALMRTLKSRGIS